MLLRVELRVAFLRHTKLNTLPAISARTEVKQLEEYAAGSAVHPV